MPSKLEQLQQQYRRQLLQEKEERMIKIHTESQQKALSKVSRYNGVSSVPTMNSQPHHSPVKKGSPGVDRSRPLPPIAKERNAVSNRTSPVSASTDNATKVANFNSRSKSMDLVDSRVSPPRATAQADRGQARNGYSRVPEAESRSVEYEKRPDPDTLAKMRQAELQRLRAKAREETSPRSNGFTGAISKSSNAVPKKSSPAKPPAAAPPPARTRPSYQGAAAAPARKPPANGTRPTARGASHAAAPAHANRKPPGPGQEQCRVCGRNFNTDRIEKHVSICSKSSQKKVKVFDATKMRVKGTEAEQFVRKGLPKTEPKQEKKSDWRKKHSDFIEAIRQAKMVQQHLAKGGKVSDLPPPPPSDNSDYVPCPYCGRKFSPGVADRHIPKCKNIVSNKKNPAPRRK